MIDFLVIKNIECNDIRKDNGQTEEIGDFNQDFSRGAIIFQLRPAALGKSFKNKITPL